MQPMIPMQLTFDAIWHPAPEEAYQPGEMVYCSFHHWWLPEAFYPAEEIERQMSTQGFLDCPFCVTELTESR